MPTLWICLDNGDLTPAQVAAVRGAAPGYEVVVGKTLNTAVAEPAEVEVIAGHFGPEDVLHLPNLRWGQLWAAGVDRLVASPDVAEKDFVLTNASGIHAIQISEHILALLLAFARNLHTAVRRQRNHVWEAPTNLCPPCVFELEGATMLLIGVGSIGARTAQLADALGMDVTGVRRTCEEDQDCTALPGVSRMIGPEALLDALPEADVVVLTAPLTDRTRGMIGEAELRAMKETAILVNIGRGGTVDQEALVVALREGRIGGAGLDVVDPEPLPAASPLWDMENVILTAHYAGHTPHYNDRALALFLDNLARYRAGAPLRNQVDFARGY